MHPAMVDGIECIPYIGQDPANLTDFNKLMRALALIACHEMV
jgi:hypothetical protein